MFRSALLSFAGFALWFCLHSCSLGGTGDYYGFVPEPREGHLRWCNSGEPEYIDPALVTSTTGVPIAETLFAGFAEHDPDGLPELSLGTNVETSPQLTKFTFTIRGDAKWSDGRPITTDDFVYHMVRTLHPDTLSRFAGQVWEQKIKNAEGYFTESTRRLLVDVPGIPKGSIVDVVGLDDGGNIKKNEEGKPDLKLIPSSNVRIAKEKLFLRDENAAPEKAYATVPKGKEIKIVEFNETGTLAFVYYDDNADGFYGWVNSGSLGANPKGTERVHIRTVFDRRIPKKDLTDEELNSSDDPEALIGAVVNVSDLLHEPSVLGIYALDKSRFVIELEQPRPTFYNMISSRLFRPTPRHAVARNPRWWLDPSIVGKDAIVTSGPFHIEEWVIRSHMNFRKSPTYFDADKVRLDKLTIYAVSEQPAAAQMYYTGVCDAMTSNNVPSSYIPTLMGRAGKRTEPYKDFTLAPYYGIYKYIFNTEKLTNVHLRRALSMAIDRSQLPGILGGGEIPTSSFNPGTKIADLTPEEKELCGVKDGDPGVALVIKKGELCYRPPVGWRFNPEKAREELAIAKSELGDKFPKEVELKFNKGVEGHKHIAEFIHSEWKKNLGIDVKLSMQEWKTYLKSTAAGEFEVARMGWIGSNADPEAMLLVTRCDVEKGKWNPQNRARYCSAEYEKLMREAETKADWAERLRIVEKAERVMINDAPLIPLYIYTQKHLQRPYVRDLAINFFDKVNFSRVWIDKDWKEKRQ